MDTSPPGPNASPAAHAHWCRQLARYCLAEARIAQRLGLPERDWLRALHFARRARTQWLVRAQRVS